MSGNDLAFSALDADILQPGIFYSVYMCRITVTHKPLKAANGATFDITKITGVSLLFQTDFPNYLLSQIFNIARQQSQHGGYAMIFPVRLLFDNYIVRKNN